MIGCWRWRGGWRKRGRLPRQILGPDVMSSVEMMRRRVGAGITLLAYRDGRTWSSISTTSNRRGYATSEAEHLGNTPTIARASYVDDRVIDLYQDGKTIRTALAGTTETD